MRVEEKVREGDEADERSGLCARGSRRPRPGLDTCSLDKHLIVLPSAPLLALRGDL
jgi:hypothetical protein